MHFDCVVGLYQNVIALWSCVCTIATYLHLMTFWAMLTLHCKIYKFMNGLKGSKLVVMNE